MKVSQLVAKAAAEANELMSNDHPLLQDYHLPIIYQLLSQHDPLLPPGHIYRDSIGVQSLDGKLKISLWESLFEERAPFYVKHVIGNALNFIISADLHFVAINLFFKDATTWELTLYDSLTYLTPTWSHLLTELAYNIYHRLGIKSKIKLIHLDWQGEAFPWSTNCCGVFASIIIHRLLMLPPSEHIIVQSPAAAQPPQEEIETLLKQLGTELVKMAQAQN